MTAYVVEELLGRSGGTALHRAKRSADGTPVLLRVVEPGRSDVERLKREYELATTLETPALVRPLALAVHDGLPALVLEAFHGRPLTHLLDRPLSTEAFLALATPLAAAVAELHARSIVHKNLQPDSFLVDPETRAVKITDLGLASSLPREPQAAKSPHRIESVLTHLPPELTGRMNRAVDGRSDLYSLGITFFQMLTGRLPFTARDPLEWFHCHLARMPPSPSKIVRDVPEALARIVLKLLAKLPEDRYQTARGLQHDLERAADEWKTTRQISDLPLAESDTPDRLQVSERLHGREAQVVELLAGFERVAEHGTSELVLLSGAPGSGKTALAQELHKPIVQRRSFFLWGKFEPQKRDTPYSVWVQTFRRLALEIMSESEEEIAEWRSRVLAALRANGQLILKVIPEAELLIGPQPPVPEVAPAEAQNRFLSTFLAFIGVFATPQRPLALFLDDLQWADAASLRLLEQLLTEPHVKNLFIVGAYRDTEVSSASHPLARSLAQMESLGARLTHVRLGALSADDLASIVGEALHRPRADARPLAQLIHERTGGNPFFALQFLSGLHERDLVAFDARAGVWRWDIDKIAAEAYTENVVDFMVARLVRLPTSTLDALEQLACIGISADVDTLARVSGKTADALHAALWEAARASLIVRTDGTYKFLHDRIREAAYTLIPEHEREAVHLTIGRRLLGLPAEQLEERIFEVVDHLHRGLGEMTDARDRNALCNLQLRAAKKAMASIAYASARLYLLHAAELLDLDAWTKDYERALEVQLLLSECEYLVGNFRGADELSSLVLANARSKPDRARVYNLRMRLFQVAARYDDAIRTVYEGLRLFGVELPEDDAAIQAACFAEITWISDHLRTRSIPELADGPVASDPEQRALLGLIVESMPCAYIARPQLFPLLVARGVATSLRAGNTEASCAAYSAYAIVLVSALGDVQSAYELSEMSLRLNERFGDARLRGMLLFLHGTFVNGWRRHVATSIPILERGFTASVDVGDLVYAGYNCCHLVWDAVEKGEPLAEVARTVQHYADFARRSHSDLIHGIVRMFAQLVAALQGKTSVFARFDADDFDERECLAGFTQANVGTAVAYFHVAKQAASFIAGDLEAASAAATAAAASLREVMAMMFEATHHFFAALTMAALHDDASAERRSEIVHALETTSAKLARWAASGPENHGHRHALVSAEIARCQGRGLDAMRLYDEAIAAARQNGFVQYEAIAYEVAARFYRSHGFETFANLYLAEARTRYARWGAHGKVAQLDRLYPTLAVQAPAAGPALGVDAGHLDLLSVIKGSQRISGEIELHQLAGKLLEVALEQSGAQTAYLLLANEHRDGLTLEATASVRQDGADEGALRTELLASEPLASSTRVPVTLVRWVQRTRQRVILDDTEPDSSRFAGDPYFASHRPRSVLALPILIQNDVEGVLYLENEVVPHGFSSNRLATLELLASQAAISLQNARLLAQEREARREAQKSVQVRDDFIAVASHELRTPITPLKMYLQLLRGSLDPSAPAGPPSGALVRALDNTDRELGRLERLIENLLDVTRFSAGRLMLDPQDVDLSQVARDAIERSELELRRAGCEVALRAEPVIGRWDRARLEQVVSNLLSNALKYGRGKPIEIVVQRDRASAVLDVRDHGIGIPEDAREAIFGKFERAAPVRQYGGVGLGLYIVRELVLAHGGTVSVTSERGVGSTFRVELPLSGGAST